MQRFLHTKGVVQVIGAKRYYFLEIKKQTNALDFLPLGDRSPTKPLLFWLIRKVEVHALCQAETTPPTNKHAGHPWQGSYTDGMRACI